MLPHPPLVIDLDGTLLRSDLLLETGLEFLRDQPQRCLQPLVWLWRGKAELKQQLAQATELDVAVLPYDQSVLNLILTERARGRRVVLATASHRRLADRVAAHLGVFDEVLATEDGRNLSAETKRDVLVQAFGERGFDYVGNSRDDLPVWRAALRGYVANAGPALQQEAGRVTEVAAVAWLGSIDIALVAHGTLPDQRACEADPLLAVQELATNGGSVMALLTLLATRVELQRAGALAVITSVAGDRGRPSNYVYGSAKAAVSVFCEGLRARLFRSGVTVTDIRPGFVATPMTQGLALPARLVAMPDAVARRIVAGIDRGADVVYAPAFWWGIMWIIRYIPRAVFKRLSL